MSGQAVPDPWETLRHLPQGRRVELTGADGRTWRGTLVPSHELSGPRMVQIKLDNGYNVGIHVEPTDRVVLVDDDSGTANGLGSPLIPPLAPEPSDTSSGPWVALLSTGGTIASRVDYRTGGVRPVHDKAGILSFYPDLERDGPVRVVPVFDRLSEDISPSDWLVLADHVASAFSDGARGIVVAHGTDTLAFTAAALSFLLEELPGPVVLVGAQRSPDRPSSDGFTNLTTAVRLARTAEIGEVVVVMHAGLSDDAFAIHRGTRVRKMHSSRRDAFESRNIEPIGRVDAGGITWTASVRPRGQGPVKFDRRLDHAGGLLYFYPGLDPVHADNFVTPLRGVVVAGTGLGHVSHVHLPWIRAAIARGVVIVMTTQCLAGAVDPYTYATGRELLRAGVIYADDLLPETAYVKLLWALGRSTDPKEVARLVLTERAGELSQRRQTTMGST
jgi:glutamyl-tRNA(Gln) amidotransferase subunit D